MQDAKVASMNVHAFKEQILRNWIKWVNFIHPACSLNEIHSNINLYRALNPNDLLFYRYVFILVHFISYVVF